MLAVWGSYVSWKRQGPRDSPFANVWHGEVRWFGRRLAKAIVWDQDPFVLISSAATTLFEGALVAID